LSILMTTLDLGFSGSASGSVSALFGSVEAPFGSPEGSVGAPSGVIFEAAESDGDAPPAALGLVADVPEFGCEATGGVF
jgi:hypothetical protein